MSYSSLLTATDEEMNAAKRLSGIVNSLCVIYPMDVVINSWIAVRLSDGGTDGVLYETRRDAVRHQPHEKQCAYLSLRQAPGGMDIQAAYAVLKFHRDAYDAGYVFTDPEHPTGGIDMQMPIAMEDLRSQIRRLHQRKRR